jgi:hypothetical protein
MEQELNFGEALHQLKCGEKIARKGWNGAGIFLKLQRPDENSKMKQPYIYITPVGGEPVPWVASQPDLLEEDWQVV